MPIPQPITPATLATITPTRLFGPHDTFLTSVAYSPDGALLITGDIQGYIKVWGVATGAQLAALRLFPSAVHTMAFSRAVSRGAYRVCVAAEQDDLKTLKITEAGAISVLHETAQTNYRILAVAFAADDRPVTVCVGEGDMQDGRLYLIYADNKNLISAFQAHNPANPNAAFSPDVNLLATGAADGTVRLRAPRKIASSSRKIATGFNGVMGVAFSLDGARLAVVEDRGDRVGVYDTRTGEAVCTPIEIGFANEVGFNSNGTLLAVSNRRKGGSLRLYDVASGQSVRTLKGSSPLAFSPAGNGFVAGNHYAVYSKSAMLWDDQAPPDGALSKVIAPVDQIAAEAYNIRQVTVLRGHTKPVLALAFSPDNATLATAGEDDEIHLWDTASGGTSAVLYQHRADITALAFSPDGKTLASSSGYFAGDDDNTVRLWAVDDAAQKLVFEGHASRVVSVGFGPRGARMASAEHAGTVLVWNPANRDVIHRIQTPSAINHMALSPDGALIATAHGSETALEDTCVRLWNMETGELLREIDGLTDWCLRVAFSPNSQVLMVADYGGRVTGWDATNGKLLNDLNGGFSVIYNPLGDVIAITQDKTLKLNSLSDGKTLMPLRHGTNVTGVAFAADADLLAVGTADGAVVLWGVMDTSTSLANTDQIERKRLDAARSGRHTLQLKTLRCVRAQERDGDEIYIRLDGQTIWKAADVGRKMFHDPSRSREISVFDFENCRILGVDDWQQTDDCRPSDFRLTGLTSSVELEVWESDDFLRGGDDFLGRVVISTAQAGQGEQQAVIYLDGIHYILTYEVLFD